MSTPTPSAAPVPAEPTECSHDWKPFYTGPAQTHWVCAACETRKVALPTLKAAEPAEPKGEPTAEPEEYTGVRCMCLLTGCRANGGCPHYGAHCKKHIDFVKAQPSPTMADAPIECNKCAWPKHWACTGACKAPTMADAIAAEPSEYLLGYMEGRRDAIAAGEPDPITQRILDTMKGNAVGEPTDAEILHRWDTHVGDPTAKYPFTDEDKITFARAVLALRASSAGTPPAIAAGEPTDEPELSMSMFASRKDFEAAKRGEREVIATYHKLHTGKFGAHWLWCAIEQIASGVPEGDVMAEYGYRYARIAESLLRQCATALARTGGMMNKDLSREVTKFLSQQGGE